MAEEEAGFTFVDKRRYVPEAVAAEAAAPAAETQVSDAPGSDLSELADILDAGPEELSEALSAAPTTYDLLGYCINLLASQAWQKLGLLADPQTGEAQPDLAEAKVAIDAVSDLAARLETAPDTAVPAALRRDLKTLVNDLRLNYVSQRGPAV